MVDSMSVDSPPHTLHVYRWTHQPTSDTHAELVVVCLHGFTGGGLDFEVLFAQADAYRGARIWSVDLLGHGVSSAPAESACYSTRAQLEQLDHVIDFVMSHGGKRLVLLGYSMGGRLALQWAMGRGEQLAGLVLISASPGIVDEREREMRREQDARLATMIEARGVHAFLEFWRQIPLLASQAHIAQPYLSAMLERRARLSAHGLLGSLRGFGAGCMPSVWSRLATLDVPAIYLCGREDVKYHAIGERVSALMPRCALHVVDGVGHSPHLEAPGIVWPLVEAFLTEQKERQGASR